MSAIPKYLSGNYSGGAGRTASGLAMLMGNASKILQTVAANIDRDVVKPALDALYDMVMLTDTSGLLTGEEFVRVMGVQVAVQKETLRARQMEFLQATGNPHRHADHRPPRPRRGAAVGGAGDRPRRRGHRPQRGRDPAEDEPGAAGAAGATRSARTALPPGPAGPTVAALPPRPGGRRRWRLAVAAWRTAGVVAGGVAAPLPHDQNRGMASGGMVDRPHRTDVVSGGFHG